MLGSLNNATVNVTDTADVATIVSNAFEILSAGVKNFNFPPVYRFRRRMREQFLMQRISRSSREQPIQV